MEELFSSISYSAGLVCTSEWGSGMYSFPMNGLMHAPITAFLVEALLTGEARGGKVRLPEPFAGHALNLAAFDLSRTFSESGKEHMVL